MVNNTTEAGCDEDGIPINMQYVWWVYIVTYVVIFIVCFGLSCILFGVMLIYNKVHSPSTNERSKTLRPVHEFVRQLISGDTITSKIFIAVTYACNIIFMILTVHRAYTPQRVEYCLVLSRDPARIVELLVVLELLLFSLIRFLATHNIVLHWLNIYTLVDIVTLPHIFVSIALGIDWIGLRSARFFWLPQTITVFRLIPLPFFQSQDIIDFLSLCVYFFTLLLFGTGIVHLLELTGDPWLNYENAVMNNEFFTYAYYIIITITTVGYGDISPATTFGRIFMVVYIIFGLAFFAALLPVIDDVVRAFNRRSKYARFDQTRVPRHVIVCGHITAFSAQEFLQDFLHQDRGDKHTHILFLHPARPDKDLKNVLRSYYTRVQYIVGSALHSNDQRKSRLLTSSAVFILADKYTNTPLEEDNGNLLRLVSIKNTTTKIPVIIQLLLGQSRRQVRNIEGWNQGSDIAVCLNELKLGLLAQSCLCPGFSTLIANLFYTSDFPSSSFFEGPQAWKGKYMKGASNEIYTTFFSPSFDGKNFQEVAKICYNRLGLIMLAFEWTEGDICKFHVNPCNPDIVVQSGANGTRGYFIGQDADHVSIVSSYCEKCDVDLQISGMQSDFDRGIRMVLRNISKRRCDCYDDLEHVRISKGPKENGLKMSSKRPVYETGPSVLSITSTKMEDDDDEEIEAINEQYSIYIDEPKKLEEAILNSDYVDMLSRQPVEHPDFKNHIVLCVFADDKSPLLGLHNFIFPLRNKNIPEDSIQPVVIVSNSTFLKREWHFIRKIPKVFVVDGSPLRIRNLKAAFIDSCSICIITTMLSASSSEPAINDKEVVLCSLSIQRYLKEHAKGQVQIIADLRQESNVQFLKLGDESKADERIYKAQPFACGEAFSVSMMDSVTSSAFHNPGTLYLVEDLIQSSGNQATCRIVSLPLDSPEYIGKTFQDLYNIQLSNNNIVLGLYRQFPKKRSGTSGNGTEQAKHYVVTAPHAATKLLSTDIAFLLVNNTRCITPQPLFAVASAEIKTSRSTDV